LLERHHCSIGRTFITGCPPDPSITRWPLFTTVLNVSPPACSIHGIQSAAGGVLLEHVLIIAHLPQLHSVALKKGRHAVDKLAADRCGGTPGQEDRVDKREKVAIAQLVHTHVFGCSSRSAHTKE
jgi:hypothetical protein